MPTRTLEYRPRGFRAGLWIGGSLILAVVLAAILFRPEILPRGSEPITVFCAAGIRAPVEELKTLFREELGHEITLQYNSSGGLLSTIEVQRRGDIYIPADVHYIARAREKGLVAESIPIARFRLVIATKPGNPRDIRSLDDLLSPGVRFVVCNPEAGAGQETRRVLEAAGRWQDLEKADLVYKPTVPDAASAVQTADTIDAAFVWDSTASQYGLEPISVPELADAVATIEAGILSSSQKPSVALRFARFLASPEKGSPAFKKHGYEPTPGDPWAPVPELVVFAGGVNREAVQETFARFEEREGCRINVSYDGCGVLVGKIEAAPLKPELFLTCDASYLDMVKDLFLDPVDVSRTDIMILAREGSEIRSIDDLTRPGLSIGITEPRASALGHLSVELLRELGLYELVQPNIKVHSPTAHELIAKMQANDKLDAALVYEANCQELPEGKFRLVRIDHPRARAVQNMAPGRSSRYPQLVRRLMEALESDASRERFRARGFQWIGSETRSAPKPSDTEGSSSASASRPVRSTAVAGRNEPPDPTHSPVPSNPRGR